IEGYVRVLVDKMLHARSGKLVERVDLLRGEALVVEEGCDHCPAILGGDIGLLILVVVVAIVVVCHRDRGTNVVVWRVLLSRKKVGSLHRGATARPRWPFGTSDGMLMDSSFEFEGNAGE